LENKIFIDAGAVVNCAKSGCKVLFHAECARRAGYYLDLKEIEQAQVKPLIIFNLKVKVFLSYIL